MRSAWPRDSCNLGFDGAWVAGAQPALLLIAAPDALSLVLLVRLGRLCPAAGREEPNAFGLEIVSSLLLVQLSWSHNYYC